jgi:hypothetical protein
MSTRDSLEVLVMARPIEGEEGDFSGNLYSVVDDTLSDENTPEDSSEATASGPDSSEPPQTIEVGPGYTFTIQVPGGTKTFIGYPRTIGEPDPWSGRFMPVPRGKPPELPQNDDEMSSNPTATVASSTSAAGHPGFNVIETLPEAPPSSPSPAASVDAAPAAPASAAPADTVDA